MGNKVRIERICEFCGKTFIAKTCKTRFCCKACNDKYYKELIRSDRYNAVTKEVKEEKKKRIRLAVDELEVIQAREFISLKQLAIYLGVSRKSIYTYMRIYEIPFSQIGKGCRTGRAHRAISRISAGIAFRCFLQKSHR